jgi:hypothetical protein
LKKSEPHRRTRKTIQHQTATDPAFQQKTGSPSRPKAVILRYFRRVFVVQEERVRQWKLFLNCGMRGATLTNRTFPGVLGDETQAQGTNRSTGMTSVPALGGQQGNQGPKMESRLEVGPGGQAINFQRAWSIYVEIGSHVIEGAAI